MDDTGLYVIVGTLVALLGAGVLAYLFDRPTEEKKLKEAFGDINSAMFCQHCQSKGTVRTTLVEHKGGISGSKATAALFTAGVSLLATGLAKKSVVTQAYCENCTNIWSF